MEELDFEQEGENGERCYRELKHLSFVTVPRINWDMTTKVIRVKMSDVKIAIQTF